MGEQFSSTWENLLIYQFDFFFYLNLQFAFDVINDS